MNSVNWIGGLVPTEKLHLLASELGQIDIDRLIRGTSMLHVIIHAIHLSAQLIKRKRAQSQGEGCGPL